MAGESGAQRDELMRAWIGMLRGHAGLVAVLGREMEADTGLPLTWYDVLVNLHEAGGQLRMQELARAIVLSKSGLTRLVDRMESAGMVCRQPVPDDRRGLLAVLTDKGRTALLAAVPIHMQGINEHFGRHLDANEAGVIAEVMERVVEGLGACPPEPCDE